jgi:hypothetical protein
MDITMGGDTDYLTDSDSKKQLDAMLISNYVYGIVYFQTRIHSQVLQLIKCVLMFLNLKIIQYILYGCQIMMLNV